MDAFPDPYLEANRHPFLVGFVCLLKDTYVYGIYISQQCKRTEVSSMVSKPKVFRCPNH